MFLIPVHRTPAEFSRNLERFFDDGLDRLFGATADGSGSGSGSALRSPALDVSEDDQAYTVTLDLPGVTKEAVKINIEGRRVSIDAEQSQTREKKEGERLIYRERATSRYSRSFALPQEISQSDSSAKLEHGVLTLTLAKRINKGASQLSVS